MCFGLNKIHHFLKSLQSLLGHSEFACSHRAITLSLEIYKYVQPYSISTGNSKGIKTEMRIPYNPNSEKWKVFQEFEDGLQPSELIAEKKFESLTEGTIYAYYEQWKCAHRMRDEIFAVLHARIRDDARWDPVVPRYVWIALYRDFIRFIQTFSLTWFRSEKDRNAMIVELLKQWKPNHLGQLSISGDARDYIARSKRDIVRIFMVTIKRYQPHNPTGHEHLPNRNKNK